MYHSFDVGHAKKYGVVEAILLQNIGFWILRNIANKKHEHDGFFWTYNSISSFEELFPYVSARKIDNALKHLEDEKILKSGNFNTAPYDRTKWYAIIDKDVLWSFTAHFTFSTNGFHQNAEPIPDINTDEKQIHHTEKEIRRGANAGGETLELEDIISEWNSIHDTNYRAISGLLGNYAAARKSYSVEEIKQAVRNIKNHSFWKDKMTPTILFRKKNPQGEPVDYVGALLSHKEKSSFNFV